MREWEGEMLGAMFEIPQVCAPEKFEVLMAFGLS